MSSPAADHHKVHKAVFRPLTLCGVDRRLFFLALLLCAATFNLFYSLLAGCLVFAVIYGFARVSVAVDPQMLPIAFRSVTSRIRYDACRWSNTAPRFARTQPENPSTRELESAENLRTQPENLRTGEPENRNAKES